MEQPAAPDPLIGAQVGNYEIRRKLGEGGMGAVYMAEHPLIGKKVALKVLHHELSSNQDVVSRFFTEAKAVNDIQHPNIVDIIDYGVIPHEQGSMVYFIMEFLDGRSLSDIIRSEAPLAPERALSICIQIADALSASHRSNIVHRDLKPDNVILTARRSHPDFVKVLDFGIAKLTGDQPGSRRTRTGIVMGTPAYMSPEQCEGRGEVDHRTDVYALGILLYEMLTGRVPFSGTGYGEVLVQHLTQAPQKPSTIRGLIPPHIEAVCLKALEKRPDSRYPNMDEFMRALADPVNYVEAHGGIESFTTSNLGAPMVTPYPGNVPMATPPTGQYGAGQNITSNLHAPSPQPGTIQPVTWPTPAPGGEPEKKSRALGFIVLLVVLAGAGAGAFVAYDKFVAGGGEQPAVAASETLDQDAAAAGDTETAEPAPEEATAEPTPPVEPVASKVQISIESTPAGASVFIGDEAEARGVTPFELDVDSGDQPISFRLEADGYESRQESFVPSENRALDLQLTKAQEPVKPTHTASKNPKGNKGKGNKGKPKGNNDKPTDKKPKDKKPKDRAGDNYLAPDFD